MLTIWQHCGWQRTTQHCYNCLSQGRLSETLCVSNKVCSVVVCLFDSHSGINWSFCKLDPHNLTLTSMTELLVHIHTPGQWKKLVAAAWVFMVPRELQTKEKDPDKNQIKPYSWKSPHPRLVWLTKNLYLPVKRAVQITV